MKDQKKEFDINAVSLSDEALEKVSGGVESWKRVFIDKGELYYKCEPCDTIYFTGGPCPMCGEKVYAGPVIADFGHYVDAWSS